VNGTEIGLAGNERIISQMAAPPGSGYLVMCEWSRPDPVRAPVRTYYGVTAA